MARPLPEFASFPPSAWREQLMPDEWTACLDAWVTLTEAHLALTDTQFASKSAKDESISLFLVSLARETATRGTSILGESPAAKALLRHSFVLSSRLTSLLSPPASLLQWEYFADLSRVYGKERAGSLMANLPKNKAAQAIVDSSLAGLKKFLTNNLDAGLNGDLKGVEARLLRLTSLIHASPPTAAFLLAGSDFLDALIAGYRIMNPPLRGAIVTTTYLCLLGLAEGDPPRYSALTDQLFALKAAGEAHRAGPLSAGDSLVAELVTVTPLLQQIQRRADPARALTKRMTTVLTDLAGLRKAGGMVKPKRLVRTRVDKGKAVADRGVEQQMHMHRMSQISQIQDLFPELGSAFVSKLLDEYGDDNEQVVAHLLEGTLPHHLQNADRSEELSSQPEKHEDLAPHSTPPQIPTRHNVFDDDELDRLAVDASRLHFGRKDADKTADDVLNDRSTAPGKAAILSALAAFDSDDDERDDTYDAEDVGGTVDAASTAEDPAETNEEALFRAYQTTPAVFARDTATRRGGPRAQLKEETGMTDEAIEGWALMLSRNPQLKRRLEGRFSQWSGAQPELKPTAWRASPAGSGTEESDPDGGSSSFRGGWRGRGRVSRGHGGRGGNVSGPASDAETEAARRRKETHKGSRANHNRRDQRARKMARGGFPG